MRRSTAEPSFRRTSAEFKAGRKRYSKPRKRHTTKSDWGGASTKRATTQKAGSKATKSGSQRAITKASSQRATQRTAQTQGKAQERKESQAQQFGLMPSELDDMNREIFHADATAIKGARDTESAMRYLPFVTIINTAGFGNQFDLRGQGRLSSNGLKFQINGVNVTPVDSYYGFMPINTVLPSLIQEIQVLPGVDARGGTINVVTSQRGAPVYIVGAGYVNTMATEGNSYNTYALANENFGPHIKANAGLAFVQHGGPREGDSLTSAQAVLGGWYDIGWGQSVTLDLDVFYGKNKTSPYASFVNGALANEIMLREAGNRWDGIAANWRPGGNDASASIPLLEQMVASSIDEDRSARANKGDGEIETTQIRAVGILGWQNQLTQNLKLDVKAFAALNNRKYDKYEMYIPYLNFNGVLPLIPKPGGKWGDKGDWQFIDQTGSTFNETKFGGSAVVDWHHDKGLLRVGYDAIYAMNKRTPTQYLRQAISHSKGSANLAYDESTNPSTNQQAWIDNMLDIKQFSSSLFVRENYNFNRNFSLMGGFRYEIMNYNIKAEDDIYGGAFNVNLNDNGEWSETTNYETQVGKKGDNVIEDKFSKNYDNFLFELAPVFRYSNTGLIFARGETGWLAPPAYGILQRKITLMDIHINNPMDIALEYKKSDLKDETYYTAEIGWKEMIGTRRVPLGITNLTLNALLFSVTGFYTASQNEFYFNGDPYSSMQFGTWDKSRRMGVEVAAEQYLFDGALSFNESFTFIRAQKYGPVGTWKKTGSGIGYTVGSNTPTTLPNPYGDYECAECEEKWDTIPYTYDYKATVGAAVDIAGFLEVIDVSVSIWLQNSIYGNQRVPNREQSAVIYYDKPANESNRQQYNIADITDVEKKLKPYIISDFGVSVGLNKNMGVITLGIKNLFDTYYYDYYNHDQSASINENRYVVGRGRTVFVEGQFKY